MRLDALRRIDALVAKFLGFRPRSPQDTSDEVVVGFAYAVASELRRFDQANILDLENLGPFTLACIQIYDILAVDPEGRRSTEDLVSSLWQPFGELRGVLAKELALALPAPATQFPHMRDDDLRKVLTNYLAEAEQCLVSGSIVAALTLSGAVLEAALLEALSRKGSLDPKVPLQNRTLKYLLDEAGRQGLLKSERAHTLKDVVKDARNLIHAERLKAEAAAATDEHARLSLSAVKVALKELA